MRKGLILPLLLLSIIIAAACSEDPVPTATSGNPRIDLQQDSIVLSDPSMQYVSIEDVVMTPQGEFYAGGYELMFLDDTTTNVQGNIWKLSEDGIWRSVLDASMRSRVNYVISIGTSPMGTIWAIGLRSDPTPENQSLIMRGIDDNWAVVGSEENFVLSGLTVAGEDDVWMYGSRFSVLHYENGAFTSSMIPDSAFGSYADSSRYILDLAVTSNDAWMLVRAGRAGTPTEPAGRVILKFNNGGWEPIYAEGAVDTTGQINRGLAALLPHRDTGLLGIGQAVYRWDGEKFNQEYRSRVGGSLLCAALAPSGQILAGGYDMSAAWSDDTYWFGVHIDYDGVVNPEGYNITSLAFHDSLAVMAVRPFNTTASMLLRGPMSRITPP
ncbi:hypothetical protein KQI65_00970 [bacterium]|nr:hypothetical protein [bacterium]